MKKEVVAHRDPKSPISEIFRTLRTNIQFINTDKKTQTLLITSTLPGEGKSWIASNLAVTFAQTGKKVVLVDADMRKGRQYTIFDVPPTPGLSNYLSQVGIEKKDNISDEILRCIKKTAVPNLYLMPAGSIPPNPSELLVSPKMIKLLNKFKQAFDIVIIDGTPCELVTDAVILSRIVDSTMVVTAHKVTKKDALERVIKSIQNVGGNLTGVVVNKMPISGKKYEKKYYYYGESLGSSRNKIEENPEKINVKIAKTDIVESKDIEGTVKSKTTKKTKANTKKSEDVKITTKSTKKEPTKTTGSNTTIQRLIKTEMEKPTNTKTKKMKTEEIEKNTTEDILKKMNAYLEKENAKKEKGEDND